MEKTEIKQKLQNLEIHRHGKTIFGLVLLAILVIGIFRPIALSGIPIIFGAVTFLSGTTILAGISGLILALMVNVIYLTYHFSQSLRKLYKKDDS